ncbi:MAG: hypothetical protein H0U19_11705, partial [Acidobacteria bacterium]|nr:hypothetical protein [Acidobacteriota bacterium]
MFKRTIFAIAVAAVTYVGAAQAQENATLTLRSGERVAGQLVDMGGVGFTVRVNGQERQIPTNDVAVIDFTGGTMTADDWSKVTGGNQVVWLRNGQTVNGTLYDIGGTSPLKITLRTGNGDREFSSSEIGRIVLSQTDAAVAAVGTPAAAATPTLAAATGNGIVVSSKSAWTPTGLTVRRGEVLTVNTSGEIQLSRDANDVSGSAGAKSQRYSPNAPLPRAFAGALIARVGNGEAFAIGNQTTVTMPAAGQLFLGINDDGFEDN